MIGPPPTLMGGMASVTEQMLSLDFGGRYRVEAFPVTVSMGEAESWYRRVNRHVRCMKSLTATIRRLRPAIIHIHTCSGFSFYRSAVDMVVAKRMGCRTILHIHGAAFDKFHADAGIVERRLIAWSLSRVDRVIALSTSWGEKLCVIAPRARVAVVENAVSIPVDDAVRDHRGPCRFLLLARMDEWKGIDDLLEAAAHLQSGGATFEIVLAGPAGSAGDAVILDKKIRARGLQKAIRYVGPVRGEDKSKLLRRADVYIQPSHYEGMPLSLLEALSYGLPVVATRVGAVPEVVTDSREGLLVPPHRPDRLASAMRTLASDEPQRQSMGRDARRLAISRFSLERFRDDLTSLYDGILASAPTLTVRRSRTLGKGLPDPGRVTARGVITTPAAIR